MVVKTYFGKSQLFNEIYFEVTNILKCFEMEKIEKILKYLKVFLFVKIFLLKESIWVLEDLTYLSNRYMKN